MNRPAADWGGGYVTDIAYLPGYYHHQSPLHLNLACLLGEQRPGWRQECAPIMTLTS